MKKLHIIMPMAGEGKRFKDKGYDVPKPLIKLDGVELYRHAINSLFTVDDLPFDNSDFYKVEVNYTFIVRQEFIDEYHIDEEIYKYYPTANVIAVEKTTRGALETVMLARPYIDEQIEAILTMDCDFEFFCPRYLNKIKDELHNVDSYPLLMTFYSTRPIYSFVETNPMVSSLGVRVAEKEAISSYAIAGCYFLGNAERFFKCAERMIRDYDKGKLKSKELYISLVYNYLIKEMGYQIDIVDMNFHKDKLWSYNVPEDLEKFNKEKSIWDA